MQPRVPNLRLPQTDRPYRWSVVVSVGFHLLVLSFFVFHEIAQRNSKVPEEARSPGLPGERGGGGGMTYRIELPPYPSAEERIAQPVEKPPVPKPVELPTMKVQKVEVPVQTGTVSSSVDLSQLGRGGSGAGGGMGPGKGPGLGADSGRGTGGQGGDVFPPKVKYTILPPLPQPPSVRGKSFRAHFWVAANGRVTGVKVDPDIRDAAYRQQFLAALREYTFEPARKVDGTLVDGETTITITL